ncbi:MAG TPA: hypothetical protein VKC60_14780 [Opitutaceae bacterium]|nr:hypothetical protein [Opitutaceae bacterium]
MGPFAEALHPASAAAAKRQSTFERGNMNASPDANFTLAISVPKPGTKHPYAHKATIRAFGSELIRIFSIVGAKSFFGRYLKTIFFELLCRLKKHTDHKYNQDPDNYIDSQKAVPHLTRRTTISSLIEKTILKMKSS